MADEVKTEKTEKKLVVQMELPEDNLARALDNGVRAALWQGAIDYVLKQITPEMTNQLAMQVIGEALKSFQTWELQKALGKAMEPMLAEILWRPEVQAFIRAKVEEGVNQAITTLPDKVKGTLIERAVKGMTDTWRDR